MPKIEVWGGCGHDQELPPLKLDKGAKRILASRSAPPQTAADYFLALPSSYFSILENSPQRRVTFIETSSLTDSYLRAEHWFECDGGGFEVTIRVFDTEDGPLIGISSSTYPVHKLYTDQDAGSGGLKSITLRRPRFWRYSDGAWKAVDDAILPMLDRDAVIDRYRNHYKAHLENVDQQKFIWLDYDLPISGNTIQVSGRENFMDPIKRYIWARFSLDGQRFIESGLGQAGR